MIPKRSLDSVLEKSIILTKTAPNDNAKSISVQCALETIDMSGSDMEDTWGLYYKTIMLDPTDVSDPESDESDSGWM